MKKSVVKWVVWGFLIQVGVAQALEEKVKPFKVGLWELSSQFTGFNSDANYTANGGEYLSLIKGQRYSLYDLDLSARWNPNARYGIFGDVVIASAQSQGVSETRTNSSVSDVTLGIDYMLYKGWVQIVPEFSGSFPMTRITPKTDGVMNSDGTMNGTFRILFRRELPWVRFYTHFGYQYKDDGRASRLPYALGAELDFNKTYLGFELGGFRSVSYDQDTNTPALKTTVTDRVNAGSLKFYSVNPSVMELKTWLAWDLAPYLSMNIGGGGTINGENYAAGYQFFAGITYRTITLPKEKVSSPVDEFKPTPDPVTEKELKPGT